MSGLGDHTIHRGHIHHGWNNAFTPCLWIAPGETVQFETVDASSGQLSGTSTAADVEKLDLARVNPVTGACAADAAAHPSRERERRDHLRRIVGVVLDGEAERADECAHRLVRP